MAPALATTMAQQLDQHIAVVGLLIAIAQVLPATPRRECQVDEHVESQRIPLHDGRFLPGIPLIVISPHRRLNFDGAVQSGMSGFAGFIHLDGLPGAPAERMPHLQAMGRQLARRGPAASEIPRNSRIGLDGPSCMALQTVCTSTSGGEG